VYAYFIRKYINKIAQKCQEDARVVSVTPAVKVTTDWDDLNAVYRKIVYNDALSTVHPSRFYYIVPVCEVRKVSIVEFSLLLTLLSQCCYHVYLVMDQLREDAILHNPDHQPPIHLVSPRTNNDEGKIVVSSSPSKQNTTGRPLSSGSIRKSASATREKRPKSAEQSMKKISDSIDDRIERRKLRLMKEIDRFREEVIKSEIEQMKWNQENDVDIPPRASVSQKGKKLFADIEAAKKGMKGAQNKKKEQLEEEEEEEEEEVPTNMDWNDNGELEDRIPSSHKIPLNTEFILVQHRVKHETPSEHSSNRHRHSSLMASPDEESLVREQERIIFSRIFDNKHPITKDQRMREAKPVSALPAKGKQRPVSASAAIPSRTDVDVSKSHDQSSHSSLGRPALMRPASSSVDADYRKSNDNIKDLLESMKITTGEDGQFDLIIDYKKNAEKRLERRVERPLETEERGDNQLEQIIFTNNDRSSVPDLGHGYINRTESGKKKAEDDRYLRTSFEAIQNQHNQISPLFSYSSLPFLSSAPFLPLAVDNQFHQPDEAKSSPDSIHEANVVESFHSKSKSESASPSFDLLDQNEHVISDHYQRTVQFVGYQVIDNRTNRGSDGCNGCNGNGSNVDVSQRRKSQTNVNWDEIIERYDVSHVEERTVADGRKSEPHETLDVEKRKEEEWTLESEASGLGDSPLNKSIELPPMISSPLHPPVGDFDKDVSERESASPLNFRHDDLNIFQLSPEGTVEGDSGPFSLPFELSESMLSPVSIFYFESSYGTAAESDQDHSLSREK
jgi:hypothetical protein